MTQTAENAEKIAVVFPGQGSQAAGMLAAYDGFAAVRDAVTDASDAIGADLASIIANNADALNDTINTQPAMLAMGVGVWRAAQEWLPAPICMAGHSLGEYSALVCAGALPLAAAAKLVRRRAQLMQNAVQDGGMAAVLGGEAARVEEICADLRAAGHEVWPANYNSAAQIVLAGRRAAVQLATEQLLATGAKRAVMLPMSVPSHCPLLAGAAEEFLEELRAAHWQTPAPAVLHSAAVDDDGGGAPLLAQRLAAQLVQPVKWGDMLEQMRQAGATQVVECGPGKVLCGLGRKSGLAHTALDNAAALTALKNGAPAA